MFNIEIREEVSQLYSKSDVLLLAYVFEKFIKVSINKFGINPLFCVSYTWPSGLKFTGINLQTLRYKDLILNLENDLRGGISSVMGDKYVKLDENKTILHVDAKNLYGHSMSEPSLYDEIKTDKIVKLEDLLNTPDDGDF